MYEKLVSHKLTSFCEKYGLVSHKLTSLCEKYGLLPGAQFAYRKGLGCTDALLTISLNLQKSLDAGMESYIVQLDFGGLSIEGVISVSYSN